MNWWDFSIGRGHDPSDNAGGGELGIDLSTPVNTPITTPWAATVTYTGYSASTGGIVKVATNAPGIGPVYAYFLHLNTIKVILGQALAAGAVVGLSGGTQPGAGGWPHVEFGLFTSAAYARTYWGFVTGSTLDPTGVITALRRGGGSAMSSDLAGAGWKDTANFDPSQFGGTLTAPNGVPVVLGFRQYVLHNAWESDDWPLAPQYHAASVEPGNPAIGEGDRLDCRKTSLGYTTARSVYRIWTGQDYQALQAQVAALTARIAAAQKALGG